MLLSGNKRAVSIYWTVKWLPEVITLLLGQTDRDRTREDRPKITKTDQFPVVLFSTVSCLVSSLTTAVPSIIGVNVPLVPVWPASFWDEWVDYKWGNKLFIRILTVLGMAGIVCLRVYTHGTR